MVIIIDPWNTECSIDADIMLITHSHWDHLSLLDMEKYINRSTRIIADKRSSEIIPFENVSLLYPMITFILKY